MTWDAVPFLVFFSPSLSLPFSLSLCFAASAFTSEWLLRFWSLTFFTWASGPSRRSKRTRLLAYCHLCNNSYRKGRERDQQGQQQQKQQPSEFIRGVIFGAKMQVWVRMFVSVCVCVFLFIEHTLLYRQMEPNGLCRLYKSITAALQKVPLRRWPRV